MLLAHAKWTSVQGEFQAVAFQSFFESSLDIGWVGNSCQRFTALLVRRLSNFQPRSHLLQFRSVPLLTAIMLLETPLTYRKSTMFLSLFYSVCSTTTTPSIFLCRLLTSRPVIISVNSVWCVMSPFSHSVVPKPNQILLLSPHQYWAKQDYPTKPKYCDSSYIPIWHLPASQEHSTGDDIQPVAKCNPHIFSTEHLLARSMTYKTIYLTLWIYTPFLDYLFF